MLIPCHRSLFTGNSDDADADCVLNVQTTSHITPSPSSVSSPTTRTTTRRGGTSSEGFNMFMNNCTCSKGQYSMYVKGC